jgi:hypothetical protein
MAHKKLGLAMPAPRHSAPPSDRTGTLNTDRPAETHVRLFGSMICVWKDVGEQNENRLRTHRIIDVQIDSANCNPGSGRKCTERVLSKGVAGQVAELADALDLGSSGATRQSSNLCLPMYPPRQGLISERISWLRYVVRAASECARSPGGRERAESSATSRLDARCKRPREHISRTKNPASAPCGSSSVVEHRLAKARVASSNLVFR